VDKICPYCKGGGFMMSKAKMISEILKIVGWPEKKSIYSDGNMTREEMFAVFTWIKEREIEARKSSKNPSGKKNR
jgi:hypothetical protein